VFNNNESFGMVIMISAIPLVWFISPWFLILTVIGLIIYLTK